MQHTFTFGRITVTVEQPDDCPPVDVDLNYHTESRADDAEEATRTLIAALGGPAALAKAEPRFGWVKSPLQRADVGQAEVTVFVPEATVPREVALVREVRDAQDHLDDEAVAA